MSDNGERWRALTLADGAAMVTRLRHIARHESWPVARAELTRLAVEQPGALAAAAMAAALMLDPDATEGELIERMRSTDAERRARGVDAA